MGDEHDRTDPGGEEGAEPPDLAALLTEVVRAAALRLPTDRVLPVVYAADPFPGAPDR